MDRKGSEGYSRVVDDAVAFEILVGVACPRTQRYAVQKYMTVPAMARGLAICG